MQGNLAKYGLDEAELVRRKAFVTSVKQQIQSLRSPGEDFSPGRLGVHTL